MVFRESNLLTRCNFSPFDSRRKWPFSRITSSMDLVITDIVNDCRCIVEEGGSDSSIAEDVAECDAVF